MRPLLLITLALILGCNGSGSTPFNNSAYDVGGERSLYVVSGACYGGGVTTSTGPANTVAKYNLNTGALEKVVVDYNVLAPGDSPVAIQDYDNDRLLVLVENTGGRRVDLVNKNDGTVSTYLVNTTALGTVLRSFAMLTDLSLLVSKSGSIEKFNSGKARVMIGANAFVNNPAGVCATSTTLISSVVVHGTGKIIFTHAGATPNNRIAVVSANGYSVAGDCLAGTAGPVTTALPTRALLHSSGKLLVAFGSTTLTSNFIYSYDFNGSTGAITNPIAAYRDGGSIVNGPSAMVENPTTGDVLVANVTSTYNTIEKFRYNAGGTLTRVSGGTFIPSGIYTRCVADMKVMH